MTNAVKVRRAAWNVASRTAAAVLAGYALAHTLPVALGAALPVPRAEAALFAIQLSFVVYTASVIWAFSARSATRAWFGLLLPVVATGIAAGWLL